VSGWAWSQGLSLGDRWALTSFLVLPVLADLEVALLAGLLGEEGEHAAGCLFCAAMNQHCACGPLGVFP
jgi:hypothetical protein